MQAFKVSADNYATGQYQQFHYREYPFGDQDDTRCGGIRKSGLFAGNVLIGERCMGKTKNVGNVSIGVFRWECCMGKTKIGDFSLGMFRSEKVP